MRVILSAALARPENPAPHPFPVKLIVSVASVRRPLSCARATP
jgi:hypothetical protein